MRGGGGGAAWPRRWRAVVGGLYRRPRLRRGLAGGHGLPGGGGHPEGAGVGGGRHVLSPPEGHMWSAHKNISNRGNPPTQGVPELETCEGGSQRPLPGTLAKAVLLLLPPPPSPHKRARPARAGPPPPRPHAKASGGRGPAAPGTPNPQPCKALHVADCQCAQWPSGSRGTQGSNVVLFDRMDVH